MSHSVRPARAAGPLALAAMAVFASPVFAQSPINLVLDTGVNTPLHSRITGNGAPITVVGPSNPIATINGVTIRYVGTDSVTPLVTNLFAGGQLPTGTLGRFVVQGDLNLAAGQRIYGIGPNLIRLEVGSNANIGSGSLISVSGEGQLGGAGGGTGGEPDIRGFYDFGLLDGLYERNGDNNIIGGSGGAGGMTQPVPVASGSPGQTAGPLGFTNSVDDILPGTNAYARLFRSTAGGDGTSGQGNLGRALGGIERAYRRVDNSIDPDNPDNGVADFEMADSGTGGTGGAGGAASIGNTVAAQPGGNGGNGENGMTGLHGANASAIVSLVNPTIVSLRGGNGGGAGATGGDGLPGGAGGGGGGGGSFASLAGGFTAGHRGGDGGAPGLNGSGGMGGEGGGGGGGIQIVVRGQLTVETGAALAAAGGNGIAGELGSDLGTEGGAGSPGASSNNSAGRGGNGGNGGNGGRGGNGGMGVGGTGGTIQIVASSLNYGGTTFTQGGLAGDFVTRSADGATYLHGYSGASANLSTNTYFGARAGGANPYRSHSGTFTLGGAPTNLAPNVPLIEGGAAPYGILDDNAGVGSTIAPGVQLFTDILPSNGRKRLGAVTRVGADFVALGVNNVAFTNDSQQLILFTAFDNDLQRPALSVVDPSHATIFGDYIPDAPVRLRAGNGYLNDPTFTPGAVAPTDMATLRAYKTFAMYASGTQTVAASVQLYGGTRTFIGTPTPRDVAGINVPGESTVYIEDRGLAFIGFNATSNSGGGVVGFDQEIEQSGEYDGGGAANTTLNLRAGDTGNAFATVYGTGNAGTFVNGNVRIRTLKPQLSLVESGPLFTQLNASYTGIVVDQSWQSGSAQIVTNGLAIGTTNRVGEVIFNPDYDDTTRTIVFPVGGRIFGPSPRLAGTGIGGDTFTLPDLDLAATGGSIATAVSSFDLVNDDVLSPLGTVWSNAIRNNAGLISLTILGYELIDANGVFSVTGLNTPITLRGNELASVGIDFDPTALGDYSATLRLLTDMNAPAGQTGDTLTINLFATAIPEPASVSALVGAGMLALRRRRTTP